MDTPINSANRPALLCIVTIHGIGFQQPPQDSERIKGYADDLHDHLSVRLNRNTNLLGDDPCRKQYGIHGPVYVQSWYPPNQKQAKSGLIRLGTWTSLDRSRIEHPAAPLVDNPHEQRVAHVALVYSHLEGQDPLPGASLITVGMVATALFHYTSLMRLFGLVRMLLQGALAQFRPHSSEQRQPKPSLRLRSDPGFKRKRHYDENHVPTGPWAILKQLQNDVAAYVCRNEMRERIRSFVLNALLRLAARDDVSGIVINAHSNGTVIALDVLRQLPPPAAEKVKGLVTAGSPLRKYIHFFRWGQQHESSDAIKLWINYWDPKDPVADPLEPPLPWRLGDPIQSPYDPGLFLLSNPDHGNTMTICVKDKKVNNLKDKSGSGLQAHNYWDNEIGFIEPLAKMVEQLVVK